MDTDCSTLSLHSGWLCVGLTSITMNEWTPPLLRVEKGLFYLGEQHDYLSKMWNKNQHKHYVTIQHWSNLHPLWGSRKKTSPVWNGSQSRTPSNDEGQQRLRRNRMPQVLIQEPTQRNQNTRSWIGVRPSCSSLEHNTRGKDQKWFFPLLLQGNPKTDTIPFKCGLCTFKCGLCTWACKTCTFRCGLCTWMCKKCTSWCFKDF